jgi:signal transduction histidine kinase
MIVNLDAAYARERRFVSDASHELRNPLASLLINVDNAIEESGGEGARESLESMKSSIRRLSHLVSQLLELSHFENPLSSRTLGQVDLCRVCRQVVESFESRSARRGYDIEMQLQNEGCDIRGDESLLSSLVTNLLDNAAKYGGADVRIRVRCRRQGNGVLLEVEDSGAGLDAEQRAQALERFYRAADTNTAGAGLGLSIVKTIADIHDAGLELAQSELGGLAVRIRFDND